MLKVLVILSLSLSVLAIKEGATRIENLESFSFEQYLDEYEKTYSQDEYAIRQELFYKNLAMIIAHNSDETQSWKMGITKFTDVFEEEMDFFRGYKRNTNQNKFTAEDFLAAEPIKKDYPQSLDWRNTAGVVTAVKDQGSCGSCWAFSATESIESAVALASGSTAPVLSPQEITSCTPNPMHCGGTGGCQGATEQLGFEYAIKAGMASEADYPYRGTTGTCQMSSKTVTARISAYVNVTENSQSSLFDAINLKPVSISVDAGGLMQHYYSGTYTACSKNAVINHAIQLVGYDMSDSSNMYWIVRNSWGKYWGTGGYGKLKMYANGDDYCGTDSNPADGSGCDGGPSSVKVCGMCGILYDNSYPVV